jgi:hypothetical protein
MRIVGVYSFQNGAELVREKYARELAEVQQILAATDAAAHKTKRSKEKTMQRSGSFVITQRSFIVFEQFVWDLEQRGVSNIDIPVMILGVAP